jgi:DNA-binding beta-propeller fold protein YncE
MKKIHAIGCSLLLTFFLFFCDATRADQTGQQKYKAEDKKDKDKKGKNKKAEAASPDITVVKKWNLPTILQEISALTYMGDNRFACVQDESGVIFIFNTATNKIERQVSFGATGDYEGLALVGKTAYVARSDGKIFEVNNIDTSSPKVQTYITPLTAAHDVEGLTYDAGGNRLLLAIKGAETGQKDYKGIYAFDLKTKKLAAAPAIKLNLADPALPQGSGKNLQKALQPSEIAVHPSTGDIYLTEATNPQLLVLSPKGVIRSRYKLSNQTFSQPEGIAFGPAGELYISNEGKKASGNIVQVNIR